MLINGPDGPMGGPVHTTAILFTHYNSNAPKSFILFMNSKYFASVLTPGAEAVRGAVVGGTATAGLDTGAKPNPAPTSGPFGLTGLTFVSSLFILSDAGTIEVRA